MDRVGQRGQKGLRDEKDALEVMDARGRVEKLGCWGRPDPQGSMETLGRQARPGLEDQKDFRDPKGRRGQLCRGRKVARASEDHEGFQDRQGERKQAKGSIGT